MSTAALAHPAQAPAILRHADSPERWERAKERARLAGVTVTLVDQVGTYAVTSATQPGVVYATDGLNCCCTAGQRGDPVCLHRAAVRDHLATVKPCSCGGTGIDYACIWDWTHGQALTVAQGPCSCTTDPEPQSAAPSSKCDAGVAFEAVPLERELADAYSELDRNHATLHRYQSMLDRDGRLNAHDWGAFDRAGDANRAIHDRIRTLKAQLSAQNALVAA